MNLNEMVEMVNGAEMDTDMMADWIVDQDPSTLIEAEAQLIESLAGLVQNLSEDFAHYSFEDLADNMSLVAEIAAMISQVHNARTDPDVIAVEVDLDDAE